LAEMDFWQTLDSRIYFGLWLLLRFPGSPGLPLAVDQQVVEQEEDTLLNVTGGDLQQVAVEEQLRADVRQVGPLGTSGEKNHSQKHHMAQRRGRSTRWYADRVGIHSPVAAAESVQSCGPMLQVIPSVIQHTFKKYKTTIKLQLNYNQISI